GDSAYGVGVVGSVVPGVATAGVGEKKSRSSQSPRSARCWCTCSTVASGTKPRSWLGRNGGKNVTASRGHATVAVGALNMPGGEGASKRRCSINARLLTCAVCPRSAQISFRFSRSHTLIIPSAPENSRFVNAQRQAGDSSGMPAQREGFLAALQVPHLDAAVLAAQEQPLAIRAQPQAADFIGMPGQSKGSLSAL